MNYIEGEWGLPVTVIAILLVALIFGGALWFILSAEWTNRKFRQLQKRRRARTDGSYESRAGNNR